nr:MAG TPA: hypothetical protein [Caudoviricetes sp.]
MQDDLTILDIIPPTKGRRLENRRPFEIHESE